MKLVSYTFGKISDVPVAESSYTMLVEWADLAVIDISKANTPEGLAELTPLVRDALHGYGFMYMIDGTLQRAGVPLRNCRRRLTLIVSHCW